MSIPTSRIVWTANGLSLPGHRYGGKGPFTNADCPIRLWNGSVSWCVNVGAPCIGCTAGLELLHYLRRRQKVVIVEAVVYGIVPAGVGVRQHGSHPCGCGAGPHDGRSNSPGSLSFAPSRTSSPECTNSKGLILSPLFPTLGWQHPVLEHYFRRRHHDHPLGNLFPPHPGLQRCP
ncbi:MAG: hypothetical protein WB699_06240 [Bacteroidota bacterium]